MDRSAFHALHVLLLMNDPMRSQDRCTAEAGEEFAGLRLNTFIHEVSE